MHSNRDDDSRNESKTINTKSPQVDSIDQKGVITIQKTFRGYLSRKKTNIFGKSQGKEIEVYLPFGLRNKTTHSVSCEEMIGGYKYLLCTSSLFNIQLDLMNFVGQKRKFSIPEIVTAPFSQPNESITNLPLEEEIDNAVSDFLALLKNFAKEASKTNNISLFPLEDLLEKYNKIHPKHPLSIASNVKNYFKKLNQKQFGKKEVTVNKHLNTEICLVYDAKKYSKFDIDSTPRTEDAKKVVDENAYQSGELIVHIQKTFSLAVEDYKPENLSNDLNITQYQLELLKEARARSHALIKEFPLPGDADKEKIIGLLTICTEHILTVVHAKEYKKLHEKADRPVLSIRQILHYLKLNICNQSELNWFDKMFKEHLPEIQQILGKNEYDLDYRGKGENFWGASQSPSSCSRYDGIFDLFGNFANGKNYSIADSTNAYLARNANEYGIKSWEDLFNNHIKITGRTHLVLQKQCDPNNKKKMALFEARRIGIMTLDEFIKGKSKIQLFKTEDKKSDDPSHKTQQPSAHSTDSENSKSPRKMLSS